MLTTAAAKTEIIHHDTMVSIKCHAIETRAMSACDGHVEATDVTTHAFCHHIASSLLSRLDGASDSFITDNRVGIHHLHHFIVCLGLTSHTIREERLPFPPIECIINVESISRREEHRCLIHLTQEVAIHIGLTTQFISGCARRDEVTACHALQRSLETASFLIGMVACPIATAGCDGTTEIG